MQDIIKEVEVFDIKEEKVKKFQNKHCQFSYRTTIFKDNLNFVILSCQLQLKKGDKQKIKEKIREYLDYRNERHPKKPSAGSIFKNPKGFSARELVDACGLKGEKIGEAQISELHSNFIINLGGASSQDVLKLINLAKKEVKNKFGIQLEEEIIKM